MRNRPASSIEVRKRRILDTMSRLNRPIWMGDLDLSAAEHETYRGAFRELWRDGLIERKPWKKGERRYYGLSVKQKPDDL